MSRVRAALYAVIDYVGFPFRLALRRYFPRRTPRRGWSYRFKRRVRYGDDLTYQKAVAFLDGHGLIEDWGCGAAYASKFVRRSPYRGVDGSPGYADVVADLRTYRSQADCILVRHVLEHDLEWAAILENAAESFRRRMVLVVFTPFAEKTHVLMTSANGTPDIAFNREELLAHLPANAKVEEEEVSSDTKYGREHVFYVTRD